MKNKKAQLLSQPFTYIFALIVIAMIVGFGFYLVTKVWKFGGEVDVSKFKNDFSFKVDDVLLLSPGSGDDVNMAVPGGIKGICFIDLKDSAFRTADVKFSDVRGYVETSVEAEQTNENVFFSLGSSEGDSIKPIYIKKLKPAKNPLCISVMADGRLKVGLENKGKYAEVSSS